MMVVQLSLFVPRVLQEHRAPRDLGVYKDPQDLKEIGYFKAPKMKSWCLGMWVYQRRVYASGP